jgi:hypothetical protein
MSKYVVIITVVLMVLVGSGTALGLDGAGTEGEPWRITSLADFDEFAGDPNYWDDYTRLETDVNLAGRTYTTAVIAPDIDANYGDFQGTSFTGVFDGNDHKIIDLTIDDGGASHHYLGLFGYNEDAEVRNLGLKGGSVSGEYFVGCLVGHNMPYSIISNCYSSGDVSGNWWVGGLVGINDEFSIISNCYSTSDASGNWWVGSLVGINLSGSISNCYSTGFVHGNERIGGLVGENYSDSSISNCYANGDVNGVADVGGLLGYNNGNVSNCFWDTDTQTHGVTESIGDNSGGTVTNVEGLPTSQLHQQSTFTNWDFITTWNIGENQTYPYLRTVSASDINKDGITNFLDLNILCNQWMNEE